jgi:hypothetical protein
MRIRICFRIRNRSISAVCSRVLHKFDAHLLQETPRNISAVCSWVSKFSAHLLQETPSSSSFFSPWNLTTNSEVPYSGRDCQACAQQQICNRSNFPIFSYANRSRIALLLMLKLHQNEAAPCVSVSNVSPGVHSKTILIFLLKKIFEKRIPVTKQQFGLKYLPLTKVTQNVPWWNSFLIQ